MRPPTDRRRSSAPPVFLLADSAPLFASRHLFDALRAAGAPRDGDPESREIRAVYVGASNGDAPEFFELFVAAMERAGVAHAEQIRSRYSPGDRRRLEAADWIVLSGGDVERGWRVLAETGMSDAIRRRRRDGALVIGISAGAVQLGVGAITAAGDWVDTFGLVPQVVDVHDELDAWRRLERAVAHRAGLAGDRGEPGLGIPSGGAVQASTDAGDEPRMVPLAGTVCRTVRAESHASGAGLRGNGNSSGRRGHDNDD